MDGEVRAQLHCPRFGGRVGGQFGNGLAPTSGAVMRDRSAVSPRSAAPDETHTHAGRRNGINQFRCHPDQGSEPPL